MRIQCVVMAVLVVAVFAHANVDTDNAILSKVTSDPDSQKDLVKLSGEALRNLFTTADLRPTEYDMAEPVIDGIHIDPAIYRQMLKRVIEENGGQSLPRGVFAAIPSSFGTANLENPDDLAFVRSVFTSTATSHSVGEGGQMITHVLSEEAKAGLPSLFLAQPVLRQQRGVGKVSIEEESMMLEQNNAFQSVDLDKKPPVWKTISTTFTLLDIEDMTKAGTVTIDKSGRLFVTPTAGKDKFQVTGEVKLDQSAEGAIVFNKGTLANREKGILATIPGTCVGCTITLNEAGSVQVQGAQVPIYSPGKPSARSGTLTGRAILHEDYTEFLGGSQFKNDMGATFSMTKNTAYFDDAERFKESSRIGKNVILSARQHDKDLKATFSELVVQAAPDNRIDVWYDRDTTHYSRVAFVPHGGIATLTETKQGKVAAYLGVRGDSPFIDLKYGAPSTLVSVAGNTAQDTQYLFPAGNGVYYFGKCNPPACKVVELAVVGPAHHFDSRLKLTNLAQQGHKSIALENAGIPMSVLNPQQRLLRRMDGKWFELEDRLRDPDTVMAALNQLSRIEQAGQQVIRDMLSDPGLATSSEKQERMIAELDRWSALPPLVRKSTIPLMVPEHIDLNAPDAISQLRALGIPTTGRLERGTSMRAGGTLDATQASMMTNVMSWADKNNPELSTAVEDQVLRKYDAMGVPAFQMSRFDEVAFDRYFFHTVNGNADRANVFREVIPAQEAEYMDRVVAEIPEIADRVRRGESYNRVAEDLDYRERMGVIVERMRNNRRR